MADLSQYDPTIQAAASEWNLDPNMLKALILQESSGRPGAVSPAGAQGLTGIMPATGKEIGVTDLTDPVQQIYGGAKYLAQGFQQEKTPEGALLYYHGGPDWRSKYGPESAAYVPSVAQKYAALAKQQSFAALPGAPLQPLTPAEKAAENAALLDPNVSSGPAPASGAMNAQVHPTYQAPNLSNAVASGIPSDEDFLKQTTGTPTTATGGATPADSDIPSDVDFLKATAAPAPVKPPVASITVTANPQGQPTTPPTPSQLGQTGNWVGDAAVRGLHQALDVPAEALARGADYVAGKLGYQTGYGPQTAATDQAAAATYNANPANAGWEPAAVRVGTNILATLPAAMSAGGLAGGAARIGTNALEAVSPWLAAPFAAAPAIATGAASGGAVAAQTGEPIGRGALEGAALGGALGVAGNTANALLTNRSPDVVQAVNNFGIPLRAGQISSNPMIRYLDNMTAPESSNVAQRQAVNSAVAKSFGVTPEVARANNLPVGQVTPKVMEFAKQNIGGGMNAIENRVNAAPDNELLTTLGQIEADSAKTPSSHEDVVPHINNVIDATIANGGTLPGPRIADLMSHGSPLDAAMKSGNGTVRLYAGQIKDALQDFMQRNMTPEDAQNYQQLRYQYKNLMTVAPLVNKGIPGDISPLLLQGAANRSFKNNAFQGAGDLGDLGDVAQQYLKAPPQSGTEPRMLIRRTLYGDLAGVAQLLGAKPAAYVAQKVLGASPVTGPFVGNGPRAAVPLTLQLRDNLLGPPYGRANLLAAP